MFNIKGVVDMNRNFGESGFGKGLAYLLKAILIGEQMYNTGLGESTWRSECLEGNKCQNFSSWT